MKSLGHQSILPRLLKCAVSMVIVGCGTIGAHSNSASAHLKAISGGGSSGSFTPPRSGGSGGNTTLLLALDTEFQEGLSPGMSYACLQTARDARFAYFCFVLHKYSEDSVRRAWHTSTLGVAGSSVFAKGGIALATVVAGRSSTISLQAGDDVRSRDKILTTCSGRQLFGDFNQSAF
jgi:hypothetical protein